MTLEQITVFFDTLPWVVWERVKLIYHPVYEGPLPSNLSDGLFISASCLLGGFNHVGFIHLATYIVSLVHHMCVVTINIMQMCVFVCACVCAFVCVLKLGERW